MKQLEIYERIIDIINALENNEGLDKRKLLAYGIEDELYCSSDNLFDIINNLNISSNKKYDKILERINDYKNNNKKKEKAANNNNQNNKQKEIKQSKEMTLEEAKEKLEKYEQQTLELIHSMESVESGKIIDLLYKLDKLNKLSNKCKNLINRYDGIVENKQQTLKEIDEAMEQLNPIKDFFGIESLDEIGIFLSKLKDFKKSNYSLSKFKELFPEFEDNSKQLYEAFIIELKASKDINKAFMSIINELENITKQETVNNTEKTISYEQFAEKNPAPQEEEKETFKDPEQPKEFKSSILEIGEEDNIFNMDLENLMDKKKIVYPEDKMGLRKAIKDLITTIDNTLKSDIKYELININNLDISEKEKAKLQGLKSNQDIFNKLKNEINSKMKKASKSQLISFLKSMTSFGKQLGF